MSKGTSGTNRTPVTARSGSGAGRQGNKLGGSRRGGASPAHGDEGSGTVRVMAWVLGIAMAFIPLIVYLKSNDLVGAQLTSWRGQTEHIDFFNWWKSTALLLVLVVLLGLHIYRWATSRHSLEMPRLMLPLLLYLVFVLLSAISSTVPEIAFGGFPDRYEGLWVLLSYGIIAYTAFVVSTRRKAVDGILTAIFAGSLVVAGIGLFQFLDWDFFQTAFGKRLILPKAYEQFKDQLTFNFGKNIMYTTVYNPNYLGSYAALLMPVAWSWTYRRAELARSVRKAASGAVSGKVAGATATPAFSMSSVLRVLSMIWTRCGWLLGIIFSMAIFILWLGSMSRAGLLGGVAAMLLYGVLQARTILRNPIPTATIAAGMVALFLVLNQASGGLVLQEFYQTLPSRVQQAIGMTPVAEEQVAASTAAATQPAEGATATQPVEGVPAAQPFVRAVYMENNRFRFETETETLHMVLETDAAGTLHFYDTTDSVLELASDGTSFSDSRYAAYHVTVQEKTVILTWYQYSFYFSTEDGKLVYVPKPHSYWTKVAPAPYIGFEGHERFATNRGWIWSRTLPMLGKTLFVGYGPDTFGTFFPQDDIAWKINLYNMSNVVVDKPHNWYLQTALNTGVVSLLLLVWLLAAFVFDGLRVWLRRPVRGMAVLFGNPVAGDPAALLPDGAASGSGGSKAAKGKAVAMTTDGPTAVFVGGPEADGRRVLLMGILCGVIGYAIAGVFNDSVVSVAPLFWAVFGLGVGLLRFSPRAAEKGSKA